MLASETPLINYYMDQLIHNILAHLDQSKLKKQLTDSGQTLKPYVMTWN